MVFSIDTIKRSKNISLNNREKIEENVNYEDTNWFQLALEMVLEESVESVNQELKQASLAELPKKVIIQSNRITIVIPKVITFIEFPNIDVNVSFVNNEKHNIDKPQII